MDIVKHIKTTTKEDAEDRFRRHKVDIVNKLRQETQNASRESRYKVINCYRTKGVDVDFEELAVQTLGEDDAYTVFDIELKEKTGDDSEEKSVEGPRYVYDLYYTQSDYLGDAELSELVRLV